METKNIILILFLTVAVSLAITVHGKEVKSSQKMKLAKVLGPAKDQTKDQGLRLSTDVRFDGHLVGGKIQSPFESVAVVENEKSIDDLIGMRTNFSDRILKLKGMR